MKNLIIAGLFLASFGASAGVRVYTCGDVSITATNEIESADGVLYYKNVGVVDKGEVIPVKTAWSESTETYTGDVTENYIVATGDGVSGVTYRLVSQMNSETPVGITTFRVSDFKYAPVKLLKENPAVTGETITDCKLIKDTFK